MKIIELTEHSSEEVCEKIKKIKKLVEEVEEELKSSYSDNRMKYPEYDERRPRSYEDSRWDSRYRY